MPRLYITTQALQERKDITSSYFIERKMRSGHLYGSSDIDRAILEEINEELKYYEIIIIE